MANKDTKGKDDKKDMKKKADPKAAAKGGKALPAFMMKGKPKGKGC